MEACATGCSFRRLVAKVLARQFSDAVEAVCAPLQFALSTRAGTDCVGHAIRVAIELNLHLTVLSKDGVGAYDHVFRASMLATLVEVPGLRGFLPFVKSAYERASSYVWPDEEGVRLNSMRAGNQETPSCLCCSVWAYRIRSRKCGNPWKKASAATTLAAELGSTRGTTHSPPFSPFSPSFLLFPSLLRFCSTSANSTSANSTSASWPKSNWLKSKLAEVEIGRSRTLNPKPKP